MMANKKLCVICGEEFVRTNFPATFDRMVTCGSAQCTRLRSYDRWRERKKASNEISHYRG